MALWAKGQSGNPGGRPKANRELMDLARSHMPAAVEYAAEVLKDKNEATKDRLHAAEFIRDTGMGRPTPMVLEKDDSPESAGKLGEGLSADQLMAIVRAGDGAASGH